MSSVMVIALSSFLELSLPAAAGQPGIQIQTPEPSINDAAASAVNILRHNVSEKWGTICPTAAPAWSRSYPAWIHPFDNFWMTKVTVHLFDEKAVAWPVRLFAQYQSPTGMIGWGVHDCRSPEATRAIVATMPAEQVRGVAQANRYLRDHLFIMQAHDLWMASGSDALLKEMLPHCRRSVEYLFTVKDSDRDSLVETADIIEDVDVMRNGKPSEPNDAERFIDQCLTYGALLDYARMCDKAGETAEAALARTRAAKIKDLANELFWNEKGFYIFAIDTKTHQRLHEDHTSVYANGYAILFGLAEAARADAILKYLESWDYSVPGPILIPPLPDSFAAGGNKMHFPPGVYANGGCGWGRGHLPSVTLASFQNGQSDVGLKHIRAMANAANRDGSFYEYWTWEKYTGKTQPGGCKDYSETASAYLDAVIHGLFGITCTEPGFAAVRIAPRLPAEWASASIQLSVPAGPGLGYTYTRQPDRTEIELRPGGPRRFEVSVCTFDRSAESVLVNGKPVSFKMTEQGRPRLCSFGFTAGGEIRITVLTGK